MADATNAFDSVNIKTLFHNLFLLLMSTVHTIYQQGNPVAIAMYVLGTSILQEKIG